MSGVPRRTVGLVIPWYSDTMGGGAETACRILAKEFQRAGAAVEVLATRVGGFRSDWGVNHFPEGMSDEGGVAVRRFAVGKASRRKFDAINARLMAGEGVSEEEERVFLREMLPCPALTEYIAANRGRYHFVFLPYLFATTYYGALACEGEAIHIPCLHDEAYARMRCVKEMMGRARGAFFLSGPEQALARRLYPGLRDLGAPGLPMEAGWGGDGERFRAKYGYERFLLYVGRTDAGKGAELLAGHFERYVAETKQDLHLLFLGVERAPGETGAAGRIHAMGFLSEQDKRDALAGAVALCVPSVMESFSIVLMESWLAGRPAIVNEACAVTAEFCRQSRGGLWFEDYADFRGVVDYLLSHPREAAAMGRAGGEFVRERFAPEKVARGYLVVLAGLE